MFEKASRMKIRFETTRGELTVEDLWDIPLLNNRGFNLDEIAKKLYKKTQESATESFVLKKSKADEALQLKFDIVKHIIDIKLSEADQSEKSKIAKEKKSQLLNIIQMKKDEALMTSSVEDLEKMLNQLES